MILLFLGFALKGYFLELSSKNYIALLYILCKIQTISNILVELLKLCRKIEILD